MGKTLTEGDPIMKPLISEAKAALIRAIEARDDAEARGDKTTAEEMQKVAVKIYRDPRNEPPFSV